ncbi:MAG: hypothetical protein Fur002_10810 [Anaerolineales bacterium]
MSARRRRFLFGLIALFAASACATQAQPENLAVATSNPPQVQSISLTPLADDPLKDAALAAADYLTRQQLPNGELSYQVNFFNGEREYTPSHIRLMDGVGALYTACRVSAQASYCQAGDLALRRYLPLLVTDSEKFTGACFYAEGNCLLGGAAMTVDVIDKRWQATGSLLLDDMNLLDTARELGRFILFMRKPDGGFYHAFDPHVGGGVDSAYFSPAFTGMSLVALLDLREMTGDELWLTQAREVYAFQITQPATEDAWMCAALSKFARLGALSPLEIAYAHETAQTIISGEVRSLNPQNSSASSAARIEALSNLAQTLALAGQEHLWLDAEIRAFITFVQARQLSNHNCGWTLSPQAIENFNGGIFGGCEDATIRVDGVAHFINGLADYLEYRSMIK